MRNSTKIRIQKNRRRNNHMFLDKRVKTEQREDDMSQGSRSPRMKMEKRTISKPALALDYINNMTDYEEYIEQQLSK